MNRRERGSEFVMLVSPDDSPVGAIPRADLGRIPGVHFRTAHLFAFTANGELLLQQLAPSRDRHPRRWGSSVAAYVTPKETYVDAIIRRSREELGLVAQPKLIGQTTMDDLKGTKHIALFAARIDVRKPRILDRDHVAALEWVPMDRVLELVRVEPDAFTPTFRFLFERFYGDSETRQAFAG